MDAYTNPAASYLFTQSWQIALLAVVVGLISFALRHRSAHIRYLLWLVVLAKCLVPPCLSLPLAVLPERSPAEQLTYPALPETLADDSVATDASAPMTVGKALESYEPKSAVPDTKQTVVLTWLAGALLFLLWVGSRAVRYTLWLRRRRMPLSPALHQEFQELLAGFKLKKSPSIWLTKDIGQSFVWGLLRGSVYLPADFVALDDAQRQRTVLAHELSHIARLDAGINLLQVLAQAIYWFHPFVWWAHRRIRVEREKCCDERAIAYLSAQPEHYSGAIVEALAAERRSAHPIPSLAIVGSVKDIEERIKTMMKPGKKFYKRPNIIAAIVVLILALLTVPTAVVLTARAEAMGATETEAKSTKTLHEAAADGDIEQVRLLLSKGAEVNAKDEKGDTALHIAAKHCHVEVAELLLNKGADVGARDRIAHTPLHCVGSALLLSEYGGRPNAMASTTRETRIRKMAEVLMAKGADVNAASARGGFWTALHYAVRDGRKDLAELLIRNGAELNARNMVGMTPVDCAVFMAVPGRTKSARQAAKLLVAEGADVSAIHWAAFIGDLAKVKESLGEGVDVNVRDTRTKATPLFFASSGGQKDVIQFLIDEGANVDAKAKGATPLYVAVWSGQKDVAELLIEKGADVNLKGMFGTPLHIAAIFRRVDITKLLIANGADVNGAVQVGPLSATPLQTALVGAIVLDFGAGWPPSRLGQFAGLSDLLPTADGSPPGHVSKQRKALLELLVSAGADAKTVFPDTMHVLARLDAHEIAEPLIAHGLDVNTKYNGATGLHTAAQYGSKGMTELLIAQGAQINTKNNEGETPLSIAEERGHSEIVELLRKLGAKE